MSIVSDANVQRQYRLLLTNVLISLILWRDVPYSLCNNVTLISIHFNADCDDNDDDDNTTWLRGF